MRSNYPIAFLTYVNEQGDKVTEKNIDASWTLSFPLDTWGRDARPSIIAVSSSKKGDTFLTCKIVDESGAVLVSDEKYTASPLVNCYPINFF